jgi:hypothetical protein
MTESTVATDNLDAVNSGNGQMATRAIHDFVLNVDGHHVAARVDELGQQGGVVPGPSADLQDALARPDIELLQHHRNDRRLGRRAHRPAIDDLGRDRLVQIGALDAHLRHEQVTRYSPKRRLNRGRPDRARSQQTPHKLIQTLVHCHGRDDGAHGSAGTRQGRDPGVGSTPLGHPTAGSTTRWPTHTSWLPS